MRKALVGVALLGVALAALLLRAAPHAATVEPAVRYRFRITAAPASDPTADIAALEGRDGPFEQAQLAELYLARSQRTGDPADLARASQLAQASLAQLPSPNAAQLTLARIANARHEFTAAIAAARAYLTTAASPAAYTILATAHLALGELPAAADAAEQLVAERPSNAAYALRALVFAAQGRDTEAAYDFERAIVVEDGDLREAVRTRALWARFLVRTGDLALARHVLAEAARLAPDDPLVLAQQGELTLRSGGDARATFDRAFTAARQPRYLIDLARAQDLARDPQAASTRAQAEKLVRAELATSAGHALELVELLVDRARPFDLVEAIELATLELARRPSADVRFQLARAHHRAGHPRDAALHARSALASGVHDARLYELAARIETSLGNHPRAALYQRLATAIDPQRRPWRTTGMDIVAQTVVAR